MTLPPLHPRCRCSISYDEIGGRRTGARIKTNLLNDKNDPTYEKRVQYAEDYYEQVRTTEKDSFMKNVAVNNGLHEKSIEKILNHVFVEKHALRGGYRRFPARL